MAAAAEILRGKYLYSDIWFDKPPFYALFYTLSGGLAGWPLRMLDIFWVLTCALSVGLLGRRLHGVQTGMLAAALTCFALTFWLPAAVMAVAPDLLMFVPHVLAVWAVTSGYPLLAGVLSGVALLCNPKGLLVLALVVAWNWRQAVRIATGFAAVQAASVAMLPVSHYWLQVWWWGSQYSADTFVDQPVREFLIRSGGWAGFHVTAVIGAGVFLWRTRDGRLALWMILSLAGVIAGLRFFPRYFFQLLPPVVVAGAQGLLLMPQKWRVAALLFILIPVVRFGPRYVSLAAQGPSGWSDTAMMVDSRQVGRLLGEGSILVWGYRPDIYVFSRNPAGTRFLDSQPLTGVLADRHLFSSKATLPGVAAENRRELVRLSPEYIIDGLGLLNPSLAIHRYDDLRDWLTCYEEAGRTGMSVLLQRRRDGHCGER